MAIKKMTAAPLIHQRGKQGKNRFFWERCPSLSWGAHHLIADLQWIVSLAREEEPLPKGLNAPYKKKAQEAAPLRCVSTLGG